ncbi:hypothetical protein ACA910_009315 [Epithemia clementina (nom. ined.)]
MRCENTLRTLDQHAWDSDDNCGKDNNNIHPRSCDINDQRIGSVQIAEQQPLPSQQENGLWDKFEPEESLAITLYKRIGQRSMDSDAPESSISHQQATRKRKDEKDANTDEVASLMDQSSKSKQDDVEEEQQEQQQQPWTPEMHRDLVEAIYSVGMSHASPAVIMEYMTMLDPAEQSGRRRKSLDSTGSSGRGRSQRGVTNERVKSHLQKYRINSEKSKNEFLQEYDTWMRKALTIGGAANPPTARSGGAAAMSLLHPSTVVHLMGGSDDRSGSDPNDSSELLGGERAAWLSYATLAQESYARPVPPPAPSQQLQDPHQPPQQLSLPTLPSQALLGSVVGEAGGQRRTSQQVQPTLDHFRQGSAEYLRRFTGTSIPYPVLSESERRSPLGTLMRQVLDLFVSLTQYLIRQRLHSAGLVGNTEDSDQTDIDGDATVAPPAAPHDHQASSDQPESSDQEGLSAEEEKQDENMKLPAADRILPAADRILPAADRILPAAARKPPAAARKPPAAARKPPAAARKPPAANVDTPPSFYYLDSPAAGEVGQIPSSSQWTTAAEAPLPTPHPLQQPTLEFDHQYSREPRKKRQRIDVEHYSHREPHHPVNARSVHAQEASFRRTSTAARYVDPQTRRWPTSTARQPSTMHTIADEVMAAVVQRALQAEEEEERQRVAILEELAGTPPQHHHPQYPHIPLDSMTHDSNQTDLASIGNVFDDYDDADEEHDHSKSMH